MPESIKIGGAPKPSKAPKPDEPKGAKRKKPRRAAVLGVKEIVLFIAAAAAIVYIILMIRAGTFF